MGAAAFGFEGQPPRRRGGPTRRESSCLGGCRESRFILGRSGSEAQGGFDSPTATQTSGTEPDRGLQARPRPWGPLRRAGACHPLTGEPGLSYKGHSLQFHPQIGKCSVKDAYS